MASACHVGGGYTVGGTVTGLRGSGLVLQDNGGDSLTFSSNGTFTFSSGIDQGGAYSVTVQTQPSGQTCLVHNGSGTIGTADISNVVVNCTCRADTPTSQTRPRTPSPLTRSMPPAESWPRSPARRSPPRARRRSPSRWIPTAPTYMSRTTARTHVSVYSIDDATGALTAVGEPVGSGNGPFALLVDPSDQFLFVINKTDNTVCGVRDRQRRGAHLPSAARRSRWAASPPRSATDPGGNFLYVTDYAQNAVASVLDRAGRRHARGESAARPLPPAAARCRSPSIRPVRSRMSPTRRGSRCPCTRQFRHRCPRRAVGLAHGHRRQGRIGGGRSRRQVPARVDRRQRAHRAMPSRPRPVRSPPFPRSVPALFL